MQVPRVSADDVLAEPTRARLFELLVDLRRPATTQELAKLTGRHANTVRVHLRRLADAGLAERTPVRRGRGRPRHLWALSPTAMPAGRPPEAHGHLGRWLARAFGAGGATLADVEATGAAIGRELAPGSDERGVRDVMRDALTGMGFQPRVEPLGDGRVRYELRNCPYRDAVRENPPLVCALHRGLSRGLLEALDPRAALTDFVPRDPDTAGCLIDITLAPT